MTAANGNGYSVFEIRWQLVQQDQRGRVAKKLTPVVFVWRTGAIAPESGELVFLAELTSDATPKIHVVRNVATRHDDDLGGAWREALYDGRIDL